ncbi:MAG: hypothetical protein ABIP75_06810 [Pyrinomonadaceae bacterium]
MDIDKDHIVTQEETGEQAPIDIVDERVKVEMAEMEEEAKKAVAEGLNLPDKE